MEAQTRASLWRGLGVAPGSLGAGIAPRPGGPLAELGVQRHLGSVPTRPGAGALADPGLLECTAWDGGSPSRLEPSLVPGGCPGPREARPPQSGTSCIHPHAPSWDPCSGQAGALVPPLPPALGSLPAPSRPPSLLLGHIPPVAAGDGHSCRLCAPRSPWDSVGALSS